MGLFAMVLCRRINRCRTTIHSAQKWAESRGDPRMVLLLEKVCRRNGKTQRVIPERRFITAALKVGLPLLNKPHTFPSEKDSRHWDLSFETRALKEALSAPRVYGKREWRIFRSYPCPHLLRQVWHERHIVVESACRFPVLFLP